MKILGIVNETHDSGIAILDDGVPRLVIEEERLNREKHTLAFPDRSLDAAFGSSGLDFGGIDAVTTPWDMRIGRRTFARAVLRRFPASLALLLPASNPAQGTNMIVQDLILRRRLKSRFPGVAPRPLHRVDHHAAHAAMFFVSPFDEATVVVLDGFGDQTASSIFAGKGNRLERQWQGHILDSLGIVYSLVTRHLGFEVFEEGTVMALAACGNDSAVKAMRDLIRLGSDGQFHVNMDYFTYDRYGMIKPFTAKFAARFGPARRRDEPLTDQHKAVARGLQALTEEVVLHVARAARKALPSRNLCLSGGVALNCVANARVLSEAGFDRVWVPPCASDSGAPLGSALWHYHQSLGAPRRIEMKDACLGLEYSERDVRKALEAAGLAYRVLTDAELFPRVARDLVDGRIVGWFQGRFELGPRALGNRSILASPLEAGIRDVINARIKFREPFRPFAPAVLAEHAAEYFEIAQPDPFMTFAPRVRAAMASRIPAAVHVDGTARLQTVGRDANPRFHALLEAFRGITGVPILLNTSFNKQEPIVARPEEAISCYLRTEMDVLVLGNCYCADRPESAVERARSSFTVRQANLRGGE